MPDDHPQQQPAKKKRTADAQLTKDEHERSADGGADGMLDAKDDPRLQKGTFVKASTDVLKKRRILKVNRGAAPKPAAAPAAAPDAGGDEKKAATESTDETKKDGKEAADSGGGDAGKETEAAGEGEETKKNPFASTSFASAAKSNPFAAVNLASKSSSAGGGESKGFGFGAGTAASAGFGAAAKKADDTEKKEESEGGKEGGEGDKPKASVFGSGATSGFGAASSGGASGSVFGSGSASGFGAAFGSGTAASTGFGAAAKAAPTTGFGTGVFGAAGATGPGSTGVPKINLPNPNKSPAASGEAGGVFEAADKGADAANTGEEDEERVFQVRAKLFRMVPSQKGDSKKEAKGEGAGASATAQAEVGPSVPPATTSAPTKKEDEKKGDDDDDKKDESAAAAEQNGKDEGAGEDKAAAPSWTEVGMGPLRILLRRRPADADKKEDSDDGAAAKPACSYRVVQRRETTPGGAGTKLILNIHLRDDGSCTVTRQGEKFVQLATVEEVEVDDAGDAECKGKAEDEKDDKKGGSKTELRTVLYLFKVKMPADAEDLLKRLGEGCGGGGASS